MTPGCKLGRIVVACVIVLVFGVRADAQDGTKAELAKLRAEVAKLRAELSAATKLIQNLNDGMRDAKGGGPTFRGKPAGYWLSQFQDADPKFRAEALEALGHLGYRHKKLVHERNLIPLLIESCKDSDELVGNRAAQALMRIGTVAAPALIEAIQDKTPDNQRLRHRALGIIGGMKTPEALRALIAVADDERIENAAERGLAIRIMANRGASAKPAVPTLIRALTNPRNEQLFSDAIYALEAIGPDAKEAMPALVELLDSRFRGIGKGAKNEHQYANQGYRILNVMANLDAKIVKLLPAAKNGGPFDANPMPGVLPPMPGGAPPIPGGAPPMPGGGPFPGMPGRFHVGPIDLLYFHEAPKLWRQAIDEMKKRYPAPK